MTLKELLALWRSADAARRAELATEHAALLDEWGVDAAALDRLTTEPEPAAPAADAGDDAGDREPAAVGAATEAFDRDSLVGGMMIREAIAAAGVTSDQARDAIRTRIPARFTEAELTAHVDSLAGLTRDLEASALTPDVPTDRVRVTEAEVDKHRAALDGFFAGDHEGGFRSIKEAFCVMTGYRPYAFDGSDLAEAIMRESVGGGSYESRGRVGARATESLTTASWAEVLGDSIARRMQAEYASPAYSEWMKIVSDMPPVQDFRTQRRMRVGGYGVLPTVAQAGPYTALASPTDEEATYAIGKKGGTEDLTLEMIANDDVGAISKIPARLGRAAAITLYRAVFDLFPTNANVSYEAVALFAAGHSNTQVAALGQAGLSAVRLALRQQAAYNEAINLLGLTPKYLIVPSALEEIAFELSTSDRALPSAAPAGAATDVPNLHKGVEPIIVDYYADANDWFVVADPTLVPTIEVGFYQGRKQPELFTQSDPTQGAMFSNDKLTYKIRHIWGVGVLDHRGFQRATQP